MIFCFFVVGSVVTTTDIKVLMNWDTAMNFLTNCTTGIHGKIAMKQSKGNNLPSVLCLYVYNGSQSVSLGNSITEHSHRFDHILQLHLNLINKLVTCMYSDGETDIQATRLKLSPSQHPRFYTFHFIIYFYTTELWNSNKSFCLANTVTNFSRFYSERPFSRRCVNYLIITRQQVNL